jgi:hypothetical protein
MTGESRAFRVQVLVKQQTQGRPRGPLKNRLSNARTGRSWTGARSLLLPWSSGVRLLDVRETERGKRSE